MQSLQSQAMIQDKNAQPEADLVIKSLEGDKAALNALIDRHYADTFNICLKMLYSHKKVDLCY